MIAKRFMKEVIKSRHRSQEQTRINSVNYQSSISLKITNIDDIEGQKNETGVFWKFIEKYLNQNTKVHGMYFRNEWWTLKGNRNSDKTHHVNFVKIIGNEQRAILQQWNAFLLKAMIGKYDVTGNDPQLRVKKKRIFWKEDFAYYDLDDNF